MSRFIFMIVFIGLCIRGLSNGLESWSSCRRIGLSGEEHRQKDAHQGERGGGHLLGAGIVRLTAGRWAHRNDGLEQIHSRLGLSESVGGLAHIISVLALLNGDHTQRRVGVLVGGGEMGDAVVLVVGQLDVVLGPDDGRWRVRLDVALQIHVVLQSLSQPGLWHSDHWGELHFHVDVTPVALADSIVRHAVVGAAVLLLHGLDAQDVADIGGAIWKRRKGDILVSWLHFLKSFKASFEYCSL